MLCERVIAMRVLFWRGNWQFEGLSDWASKKNIPLGEGETCGIKDLIL